MVKESLKHAILAMETSQPQSSYEAAATHTEFKLKKMFIDKMDKSKSYLAAPEHKECYEGLRKSYDLNKTIFSTYGKVYSLKRSRKDKDEDPFAGSDRGLKERKTSKDAEPAKGPKAKELQSGSSKGDKPQELADPDWNDGKTPQQGPTQSWLMTLASSDVKPSKTFDKLISTPIDFSAYIMNDLNITNLTQETLLGEAFRLLKGGDYPFDLTKPLPLLKIGNHQKVPVDYFFNNDLKYLQGGISTMTNTTSLTKTKVAQYDLLGIKDMVPNIWRRNKLMHSDELYKFSEGTLTRLQTSLDDITKNIQMEYLPKRRWSTLEEKRANIMIKAIDK
nr:hypothetical protein [Tanacetum cinerariifolium]